MNYDEFYKKYNLDSVVVNPEFKKDLYELVFDMIKVGEQNYKNKCSMLGRRFDGNGDTENGTEDVNIDGVYFRLECLKLAQKTKTMSGIGLDPDRCIDVADDYFWYVKNGK